MEGIRRKLKKPEKNPRSEERTNNKLKPHMAPGQNEPGLHWETSALLCYPRLSGEFLLIDSVIHPKRRKTMEKGNTRHMLTTCLLDKNIWVLLSSLIYFRHRSDRRAFLCLLSKPSDAITRSLVLSGSEMFMNNILSAAIRYCDNLFKFLRFLVVSGLTPPSLAH